MKWVYDTRRRRLARRETDDKTLCAILAQDGLFNMTAKDVRKMHRAGCKLTVGQLVWAAVFETSLLLPELAKCVPDAAMSSLPGWVRRILTAPRAASTFVEHFPGIEKPQYLKDADT